MILPANVLRIKLGFKQPGYLFAENLQSALIGKQVSEHLRRCYGRSMYILLGTSRVRVRVRVAREA